jgi:hypothetical protein
VLEAFACLPGRRVPPYFRANEVFHPSAVLSATARWGAWWTLFEDIIAGSRIAYLSVVPAAFLRDS